MVLDSSMTEIAVAAVTVAVGAAFYFGAPRSIQEGDATLSEKSSSLGLSAGAGTGRTTATKKAKKNKKKTMPGLRATSGEESTAAEEPPTIKHVEKEKELTPKPESAPILAPTASSVSKPKKKKNKSKSTSESTTLPGASSSLMAASESSSANDGAWTRVETRRGKGGVMSDGLTTSVTGTEDEQDEEIKPRTMAERMLPAGRKTGVEDMLETPQYPEVSRVMRVKPTEADQPAPGYTWGDYEDADENKVVSMDDEETDEGGWGVVTSRRPQRTGTLTQASSQASKQASTETLSKKQRQNAAKRDAAKAAKAETEVERQARLAAHKRQVEKERIAAAYAKPTAGKGKAGGGMTASVNDNGSLVWD